jgi:hypothetical protein
MVLLVAATLLNLGVFRGEAAIKLTKTIWSLRFVVQDAAAMRKSASASVPVEATR